MPSRYEKLASLCFDEARNSNITIKHGAIITKGSSKVICSGYNLDNRTKILDQIHSCTHAEMDVANQLVNMLKKKASGRKLKDLIKKYNIWVIRIPNNFSKENYGDTYIALKNSAPCACCTKKLVSLGFKNIYYTNDEGNMIKMNVNNIRPTYFTSSQKQYGKFYKH